MIAVSQPSPAEMRAYAAGRNNKWFSPPARPVARVEAKPALTLVSSQNADPGPRVWEQQDSHVRAFLEWKGNPPLGFLKMRCREIGVSFSDIVSGNLKQAISGCRGDLIAEVRGLFPEMPLTEMGRLFGGMDHTSVRAALIKRGIIKGRWPMLYKGIEAAAPMVHELLLAGCSQREISERLNVCASAVSMLITDRGWRDLCIRSARVEDHSEVVKSMFDSGETFKAIGAKIGFGREAVRCFARQRGWKR